MRSNWPKEGTCIVILPSGSTGKNLLSLAEEWTRHRLIRPAIYIDIEQQVPSAFEQFSSTGAVNINAIVVGLNGSRLIDLFDELARSAIESVRLLATRHVSKEIQFDSRQDALVDRLSSQTFTAASEYSPADSNSGRRGIKLSRINLIVGRSGMAYSGKEELIETEWDFNVVVSPEDRTFPMGIDSFISESDEKYPGFLLSNIASAIGLWVGVEKTVFESSEIDQSVTFDKFIIQRTFVRAVKTDDVAIKVAASALKQIEQHGNPLNDSNFQITGRSAIDGKDLQQLIGELVRKTLDEDFQALSFKLKQRQPEEERQRIGFLSGVQLFLKFFLDNLISLPRNLLTSVVEVFNKKATDVLFGSEGEFTIDAREDLKKSRGKLRRYGILPTENEDITKLSDVREKVKARLAEIPLATSYRATHGNLWKNIRIELTRLLQGNSSLSQGRVVTKSTELIPEEGSDWVVPDVILDQDEDPETVTSNLNWLDSEKASKISLQFKDTIVDTEEESRIYLSELLLAEFEKESAKKLVRKCRNQLEKAISRQRGLQKIIDDIQVNEEKDISNV